MSLELRERQSRVLRAIAVFKFAKSAAMLVLVLVLLRLLDADTLHRLHEWLTPFLAGHRSFADAISGLFDLDRTHLGLFAALAAVYAGLFATEGVGLWQGRRWGEWMTIAVTSLLIPFEIWEIFEHATTLKVVVFVVNVAIVVYLLRLLLRRPTHPVDA